MALSLIACGACVSIMWELELQFIYILAEFSQILSWGEWRHCSHQTAEPQSQKDKYLMQADEPQVMFVLVFV